MKIVQVFPSDKSKFEDAACRDYGITISDLTAGEMDNLRCLMQSLFRYGQMSVTTENLQELSLSALIKQVSARS